VARSHLLLLFHARAAFSSQELREKTPPQHGCIMVGADNGALQNYRGSARHREKFGLIPPQSLAGAARSGSGVSRNARLKGQLLSRARGSVRKAGERSTKGECGSSRYVHEVLKGVPSTPWRVREPSGKISHLSSFTTWRK
jgi:hypothetical protein